MRSSTAGHHFVLYCSCFAKCMLYIRYILKCTIVNSSAAPGHWPCLTPAYNESTAALSMCLANDCLQLPHCIILCTHLLWSVLSKAWAVHRHMPPNYYYDLEDTVERRVKNGAKWTYSSLRPPAIIGFSTGSTMNLMTCLAVYGTICRELGVAMKYVSPGLPA